MRACVNMSVSRLNEEERDGASVYESERERIKFML